MGRLILSTTVAFGAGLLFGLAYDGAPESGLVGKESAKAGEVRPPEHAVFESRREPSSTEPSSTDDRAKSDLEACERKLRALFAAEEEAREARSELEHSLHEALGEPLAFPPGVSPQSTERRIRSIVSSALGPENVIELRCEEYPCLVFARVPVDQSVPEIGQTLAFSGLRSGLAFRLRPSLPGERDHRLMSLAVAEEGGPVLSDARVQKRLDSRIAAGFESQGPM